ncbi:hypothetical protein IBX73_11575 [candidate division WOR-3 bacterium]|nr:hypothetical protein [candidate division WOR-3 bacterium]
MARWLIESKILPERINERRVNNIVDLRNDIAAHLTSKEIYTPGQVVWIFWLIIDFINCLFDPRVHGEEPEVLVRTKESYRQIIEVAEKLFEGKNRK